LAGEQMRPYGMVDIGVTVKRPLVEKFADAPVFGAGEVLPSGIVITRGSGDGWTNEGDV
jgi:hypothetical protein